MNYFTYFPGPQDDPKKLGGREKAKQSAKKVLQWQLDQVEEGKEEENIRSSSESNVKLADLEASRNIKHRRHQSDNSIKIHQSEKILLRARDDVKDEQEVRKIRSKSESSVKGVEVRKIRSKSESNVTTAAAEESKNTKHGSHQSSDNSIKVHQSSDNSITVHQSSDNSIKIHQSKKAPRSKEGKLDKEDASENHVYKISRITHQDQVFGCWCKGGSGFYLLNNTCFCKRLISQRSISKNHKNKMREKDSSHNATQHCDENMETAFHSNLKNHDVTKTRSKTRV